MNLVILNIFSPFRPPSAVSGPFPSHLMAAFSRQARLERTVDESQISVSKLSEAMQTVNRVIGGKIKEGKRTVSLPARTSTVYCGDELNNSDVVNRKTVQMFRYS